ncbi:MAG: ABC transporter permease [Bacteroidales bacterium]|nr:ABC transporter permease [Bacteroidales bacterium]
MNLRTISIIIRREYLNKVKKKSFLIITFLVPILFVALCLLPTLIMMGTKESAKDIAVVDKSGIVLPFLEDTETIHYMDFSMLSVDSVKTYIESFGVDAVLGISELDEENKTVSAETFSKKPLGVDMTENINRRINDAVEAYRIDSYGIENLETIMKDVKSHVRLTSYTLDKEGKESVSESGVYMAISMILGMALYMFIALFCGMVMSSVIEEKSSRVVEVLISSVKSTELMFGKIIGVALVALTQFLLWIVLCVVLLGVFGAIFKDKLDLGALMSDPTTATMVATSGMGTMTSTIDLEALTEAAQAPADTAAVAAKAPGEMGVIVSTIRNLPLGQILIGFLLYFILGYLLYASIFAAIGSAVENEGDSQQLQLPVTIPLLLGFFIALYAFKAPDSALVFWGSMIPFTSPIVMLARLPFGVPIWELVVSLVVLFLTFVLFAYLSAKVYKVGILMFGKKSSWKDLWKWLKQK